jgi:hypothetical protein
METVRWHSVNAHRLGPEVPENFIVEPKLSQRVNSIDGYKGGMVPKDDVDRSIRVFIDLSDVLSYS